MIQCANCGEPNPDAHNHCGACGAARVRGVRFAVAGIRAACHNASRGLSGRAINILEGPTP